MGIIDASLGRYLGNHPELRPVPIIERSPIMDPNTAYRQMHEEFDGADYHEAYHTAHNLIGWLNRGGFLPTGCGTKTEIIRECARIKHESLDAMMVESA